MTVWLWIAVALAGGAGAVARFLLDGAVSRRTGRDFPYGTLVVNLTGAFVLGFVTAQPLSENVMLVAGTATVGSYTTFSTWMLETHRLSEEGQVRSAAVNVLASLIAGVALAALGRLIGGQL